MDYYSWFNSFNWMAIGVPQIRSCGGCWDNRYADDGACGSCYVNRCQKRVYRRPCETSGECVKPNMTNETVTPPTPPPSGNETVPPPPPPNITIQNCSFYKICRERKKCPQDQEWWNYWGDYGSYGGCGCKSCGCEQKKKVIVTRKRICNATADDSFSVENFNSNSSYYGDCDCVIFKNCSNTTIVPETPIVPVPPIPSGGSACNYTCEDIRSLHIALANLTAIVQSQQNDIDMLIGEYQKLINSSSTTPPSGGASGSSSG